MDVSSFNASVLKVKKTIKELKVTRMVVRLFEAIEEVYAVSAYSWQGADFRKSRHPRQEHLRERQ